MLDEEAVEMPLDADEIETLEVAGADDDDDSIPPDVDDDDARLDDSEELPAVDEGGDGRDFELEKIDEDPDSPALDEDVELEDTVDTEPV